MGLRRTLRPEPVVRHEPISGGPVDVGPFPSPRPEESGPRCRGRKEEVEGLGGKEKGAV